MENAHQRGYCFGLFAYSLFVLEHYWRHLQKEARCTWVTSNIEVLQELRKRGIRDVAFRDSPLPPAFPRIIRKVSRVALHRLFKSPVGFEKRLVHDVAPDFWLTDTSLRMLKYKIKVPKIQVFHSVTIKRYCFIPDNLAYDLILLPGNYHHQEFLKRFPEAKTKNFKVVGWPPHDDLLGERFKKEQVLSALGLDPNKRTILYAPTWNAYSNGKLFPSCFPEDSLVLTQLGKFSAQNGCNLIIKLHPGSIQIIKNVKLRSIAEEYGIHWVPQKVTGTIEDPNMYLSAADVLVSDISGIVMLYLVLDRPIIFFDPDDPSIWEDSDIPRNWRPGPVVSDLGGFFEEIEIALTMPEKHSHERCTLAERLFLACDGKSGQRAAEAVLDFAHQCKSMS